MTSIGSFAKQVPLNNGYFRTIASLAGGAHISTFLYTVNTAGTVSSWAVPTGFGTPIANALSTAFLKDMGTQVVSSGRTFRRVQVVVANLSSTDGVAGVATPVGQDSDFLCAYIESGFRGNLAPGPFVRTG
jgi:hypothetical protein